MTSHALIYGASGGIGRALTQRLLEHGWRVTVAGRARPRLPEGPEDRLFPVEADACSPDGAAVAFAAAQDAFGLPDAIFNCIGSLHLKPLHRTSPAEFAEVMRVHVFSSYAILRQAAEHLVHGGSVTLLSSAAARTGLPNHEAIGAAKAAIEGLTLSAAATYAPRGLRVNAVAPGLTETPMTRALTTGPGRAVSERMHALGRLGKPEDIASALAWLADPEQSWVTGQILHVDGGLAHLRSLPRQG
jgi:3-oxoacyl-[acyl-carrier protein] reductase